MSDCASIALLGDDEAARRASSRAAAGVRGRTTVCAPSQALEHVAEDVVLEAVIERHRGRRADDRDRLGGIEAAARARTAGSGSKSAR